MGVCYIQGPKKGPHNLPSRGSHLSKIRQCNFESQSGQNDHYKIGIWWFSAKHAKLRNKRKCMRVEPHMSTSGLFSQWASTIKSSLTCMSSTKRTSSSQINVIFNSKHNPCPVSIILLREICPTHLSNIMIEGSHDLFININYKLCDCVFQLFFKYSQ